MFYLLLAFLLFIGALIYAYKDQTLSRGVKLTLFLCFWLVAGLAWQTGVDWKVYGYLFDDSYPVMQLIETGEFGVYDLSTEPGYKLISSIVRSFTDDYQILHIVVLFIASVFFFKALSRYTQNFYLVILIYLGCLYFTLNMSGIRQALALSILFYALQFIESKQFWRFLFFMFLASMCHYSSAVILPLYWLLNKKIPVKLIYVLVGVGMVVYLARLAVISGTIERVSEAVGNPIFYRMYLYVTSTEESLPSISLKMFLNVILLVMVLLRRDAIIEKSKYANIFINLFVIYILVGQYMWDTGEIAMRFGYYFILGLTVSMPLYMETLRHLGNRLIFTCFIFILSVWSSNPIFFGQPSGLPYNPYQNYIWYQITSQPSTGEERLKQWSDNAE